MKFILLITGCFLFLQGYSQKKLLILGSSTSTCFFGPSTVDSCYVTRLQRYYQDKGAAFILDNRAVAGDNCYHGMPLNYIPPAGRNVPRPYYNITEGLTGNPDVVLVNYPSNGYDIYSVQEVMFCLRSIKQTANSAGKPCYITTTQPRDYPGDDTRRKMAEIRDSVLKEFGSYAINFWDDIVNPATNTILDVYNTDGTHLNNAGHAVLFRKVAEKDIMNLSPVNNDNGLRYRYYEGDWNSLPDFNSLVPAKTGSSANVNLGVRPAGINDHYAFIWDGYINIPVTGTYTFESISDDGSKLYINGSALLNNDGVHAQLSVTVAITLAAGQYPISIAFFEKDGGETLQLYWSGPGLNRQIIPDGAFIAGAAPSGSGLNYRYYEGNFNSLPDFNTLSPVKSGNSPNIDLGVRPANITDHFAFIWDGYINIPTAGTYTFETVSDDGSKVSLNGAAIVNNDGVHAPLSAAGSITLAAGMYPISIAFFEKDGGETMQVYWSGPGFGRQVIPDAAFRSGTAPSGSGLNYKYYEGNFNLLPDFSTLSPVKTGNSPNIDLSVRPLNITDHFAFMWDGYINIPTAGTYTFETISDDGSKMYIDGSLSVNNDGVHAAWSSSGSITLAAGQHPISVTFFEKDGGETMQLYWSGPGFSRQPIPNSAFTTNTSPILMQTPSNMNVASFYGTIEKTVKARVYPNPFNETLSIDFYNADGSDKITIEVYDLFGRLLNSHHFGNLPKGNTSLKINLGSLRKIRPGLYFVKLSSNGVMLNKWKLLKGQ